MLLVEAGHGCHAGHACGAKHATTTSPERLDEIIHNTQSFDLVVLTGTWHRAPRYEPGPITRHKMDNAIVLQAGHGTGKYTNKSTGISFFFVEII